MHRRTVISLMVAVAATAFVSGAALSAQLGDKCALMPWAPGCKGTQQPFLNTQQQPVTNTNLDFHNAPSNVPLQPQLPAAANCPSDYPICGGLGRGTYPTDPYQPCDGKSTEPIPDQRASEVPPTCETKYPNNTGWCYKCVPKKKDQQQTPTSGVTNPGSQTQSFFPSRGRSQVGSTCAAELRQAEQQISSALQDCAAPQSY
jgi:hypothetical protein